MPARPGDRITTFFAATQNVCFWHKADIPTRSTNFRFQLPPQIFREALVIWVQSGAGSRKLEKYQLFHVDIPAG
jgi:hypothetical protein